MSLKEHYDFLMEIKNTPGTNDKIDKLKEFLEDETFLRVIKFIYDSNYQYGIKKMPPMKRGFHTKGNKELFDLLELLATQKGTTNLDKAMLVQLASIDQKTYDIVKMIVVKDCKCGFGVKSINKAKPNTVFSAPYMRCSTSKKINNIKYPALVQEKADGCFVNFSTSKCEARTRNWKAIHQIEHITELFKDFPQHLMIHGELLVKKNGKILDRKTGNGILNSCLQGTADLKDAKNIICKVWDCISEKAFFEEVFNVSYIERWGKIKNIVHHINNDLFTAIETEIVQNYEEAREFYDRMRATNREGAIIKNYNGKWKFHNSPDMVKLKNIDTAEMRVVGWKYGKEDTRFSEMMGAVLVESEDGKVKVSISGFSDEMRAMDWDEHIGKIISVDYEGLIKDKSSKCYSLYLPRRKKSQGKIDSLEFRFDKDHADTLKDMLNR